MQALWNWQNLRGIFAKMSSKPLFGGKWEASGWIALKPALKYLVHQAILLLGLQGKHRQTASEEESWF